MNTNIQNKNEIMELASDFDDYIKKKSWVSYYDPETDEFSATIPKLSDSARIRYFNNEIAFYVAKNKIEGVFIEYFYNNFLHKNKEFKPFLEPKKNEEMIKLNERKIEKIAPNLEKAIKDLIMSKTDFSYPTSANND